MAFVRLFAAGELVPVDLNHADSQRMAELVEQYDLSPSAPRWSEAKYLGWSRWGRLAIKITWPSL
jgi:hypothetical protein